MLSSRTRHGAHRRRAAARHHGAVRQPEGRPADRDASGHRTCRTRCSRFRERRRRGRRRAVHGTPLSVAGPSGPGGPGLSNGLCHRGLDRNRRRIMRSEPQGAGAFRARCVALPSHPNGAADRHCTRPEVGRRSCFPCVSFRYRPRRRGCERSRSRPHDHHRPSGPSPRRRRGHRLPRDRQELRRRRASRSCSSSSAASAVCWAIIVKQVDADPARPGPVGQVPRDLLAVEAARRHLPGGRGAGRLAALQVFRAGYVELSKVTAQKKETAESGA